MKGLIPKDEPSSFNTILLVLEPEQLSDPELENEKISESDISDF